MKNQASHSGSRMKKRLRCAAFAILFMIITFVVWFFAPVLAQIPVPTRAMIEAIIGPTSDATVGWIRAITLPLVAIGLVVVLRFLRRLVKPLFRKYQTSRLMRLMVGETFDAKLLMVALAVGFVSTLIAIIVGHQLGWSELDRTLLGLRQLTNDVLIENGDGLLIANMLAFLIIGRDRVGRLAAPVIRFMDQGRFGTGGSSRFATLLEEAPNEFRKLKDLYMGRSLYSPFKEIGLGGKKHMLTFGPSRGGWKGSSAIITNILRMISMSSLLVIDPKRTAATVTERFLASQGKKVYVVEPYAETTACFNPLDDLDPDDLSIRKRINSIADALIIPTPNQKDPHWDRSARSIVAGLIGHILTTYEDPVLPMIRDLLTMPGDEQQRVWEDMSHNDRAGGLPREAGARLLRSKDQGELLSVLATIDSHTEWLSDPAFERVLSKSDFSMADLKREPTAVFVSIPAESQKTTRGFCRLFINLQLAAMPRGGRSPIPVLTIVDEAASLGKMEAIAEAYRMNANFNCTIWCFAQDIPSMQCYGDDLQSMIANSRAVQILGVDDLTTARYVSERLGKQTVNGKDVPLRMPDEVIRDLSEESQRQYILRSGKTALLLRKVQYFNDPKLKGLYDPDPDFIRK